MIRNPYLKMKDRSDVREVIIRRIEILSDQLHLDPKRIRLWCIAQTVLSGIWNAEGPKGPEHAVWIAEILDGIEI
jgi:streptomycin 6-kinase